MGKYIQNQAKIPGADKFYSQNETNQKYIDNLFNSEERAHTGGYTGDIQMNIATSSDAARIYRYDPETKTLVRDFYNEEADKLYDSDQSLHYSFIDSKDLSVIKPGKYFYFLAGESEPVNVTKQLPIDKKEFGEDPDFWAAVEKMKQERAAMPAEKLDAERRRHKAQIDSYDFKRTFYLNQELFGSSVTNTGSDFNRDFAQTVNNGLANQHKGVDYNYNCKNARLSEQDMIAMTILSYGNPLVTGKAYDCVNPMASASGAASMWSGDLFIERSGKLGVMLDWHISARLDAKKNIEAFDESGDISILGKAVANGILATIIGNNHTEALNVNVAGNLIPSVFLNEFLKKPGLLESAKLEAEKMGKSAELNEGLKLVEKQCHEYKLYSEMSSTGLRIANLKDGRLDGISPDEAQNEIKRLEDAEAVNKTIIALLKYSEHNKSNQFSKYPSVESAKAAAELSSAVDRARDDETIPPEKKWELIRNIAEGRAVDATFANKIDSSTGVEQLIGTQGGIELLRDVIKRSKLKVEGKNADEVSEKLIVILEDSGIIPKRPAEPSQASVDAYRAELDSFDPEMAISRYNIEKLFAKTDETVSLRKAHEEISADMLASAISSEPDEAPVNTEQPKDVFLKTYVDYGKKYDLGLFSLKTDSTNMFYGLQGKGRDEDEQVLRNWQAEIDAVEIPHSNIMSDQLIEFAVFGRCMQDDLLLKMQNLVEKNSAKGSTIPKGFDPKSTLELMFFDNMLKDDERFNTHVFRGCVAEGRREIKKAVENESADELKKNIKSAFDVCLTNCLVVRDIEKKEWLYSATKIVEIKNELGKAGLSLKDIGATEKQLKQVQVVAAKYEFMNRYLRNEDLINENLALFKSSGGAAKKSDPRTNPELYNAFLESIIEKRILHRITSESQTISEILEYDLSLGSKLYAEKEATPTEQLLLKDPSVLLEYYKDNIAEDENYKALVQADTYEKMLDVYSRFGETQIPEEILPAGADVFEKTVAEHALKIIKDVLKEGHDVFKDLDIANADIARQLIDNISDAVDELEQARATIKDFSSPDELEKLRPIYAKIYHNHLDLDKAVGCVENAPGWLNENEQYFRVLRDQFHRIKNYRQIKDHTSETLRNMDNFAKQPASVSNLKENVKIVNELCEGKVLGDELRNFKDHLGELSSLMDASFGKDSSNAARVSTKAVADKYRQLIGDINVLEKGKANGLSDKLKFVITGIKTSVTKEYANEILPVEAAQESFGKAYEQNIAKNAGANVAREKNDLNNILTRLEAVSSRFGGNSKEFQTMLDDARAMSAAINDRNSLRQTSDKLSVSVNKYIEAKKTAPATGKGQARLNIAKELRDISRNLIRDITADISKETKDAYFAKALTVMDKLRQRSEQFAKGVAEAWKKKDGAAILNGVSVLVYLNGVERNSKTLGDNKVAELITPERIKASAKQINKLSANILKNIDAAAFDKAIESNSITAFIIQKYDKLGAAEAQRLKTNEAMQRRADKADAILTQNRGAMVL